MKLSEEFREDLEKTKDGYLAFFLTERLRIYLPKIQQLEKEKHELIEIIEMKLNAECMLCKKDIKEDINGCLENCLNNDFRKKLLNIKDGK